MFASLALLAALPATTPDALPNLDFREGRFTHWNADGFYLTTATGHGPSASFGVCSSDLDGKGRRALLYRTFVVPPGAGTIRFSAYAAAGSDRPDELLNVLLEAAEREVIPKLTRGERGWETSPELQPGSAARQREYVWSVADRVGETVRILIVDQNAAPGRFVYCSGFRIEPVNQFEKREFVRYMQTLVQEHRLPPLADPFLSPHFLALSNTDEKFTREQLEHCELMYRMFLNHFHVKGFRLREPATRLMVALFSSPDGLDAYLGYRMPSSATGVYHPTSNRLVVYDYGRNRALVANRRSAEDYARNLNDLHRDFLLGRIHREAGEMRADTNIATVMHEVAHQLSFNTGLLNRDGDLPVWLVEGIATYCESTENGLWKGIGEKNPERLKALHRATAGGESLLPLRVLVAGDDWMRSPAPLTRTLTGYAQSWALVKMLMEEQPGAMRRYCERIYHRRTPDHRLTDFLEAFGADLAATERRHREYVLQLVKRYP